MKKRYIIFTFIAVLLIVGVIYFINYHNKVSLSYVSISINPDIELAVNSAGVVEEVIGINDDADILLADLDLVGMTIEEASDLIVEEAIEVGFIDEYSDENEVIITVNSENDTVRNNLEQKVINRINNKFQEKRVYLVVVSMGINDDIRKEADEYGISANKMLFVERAMSVNPTLDKNDLVNMEINEIQQLIKDYVAKRHEAMKETKDKLKEAWKREKEELKEQFRIRKEALQNRILEEEGLDPNNMTSDQRKESLENVLKERKENIKNRMEQVKEELKEQTHRSYSSIKETIKNIRDNIKNRNNQ